MCGFIPHSNRFSNSDTSCPVIQLSPDAEYPELVQTSPAEGSAPRDGPPVDADPEEWVPRFPTLCLAWLQIRASRNPLLGLILCKDSSQSSGKHFTYICQFIVRGADEQPDEEVTRARSRGVLSAGASVPMELRHATFWCVGMGSTRNSLNSFSGVLWTLI